MTAIRNYNNLTLEEQEEFLEPLFLPRAMPKQTCLRCGNHFPGGLKRCTACGLEVNQAYQEPEAALPWRGYERGVIECSGCGFESPDRRARKNLIQKCIQCGKVVYIPSGLYNKNHYRPVRYQSRLPNPLYHLFDILGAGLSRFSRSKMRWPMVIMLVLLGLGILAGSVMLKQKNSKPPEVIPPIKTYYTEALKIRTRVVDALTEFQNDSGGMPLQSEYDDRRNPAKRERFIRAGNRILGILAKSIDDVRALNQDLPVGAENYQTKFLTMLYAQQKFYAQLKDSIEQNGNGVYHTDKEWKALWDSAFKMKEDVREASKDEIEAMNNLQSLVIRPKDPKP